MINPFKSMEVANSWMKFAVYHSQLSAASAEVIMHRTMQMSQGTMTGPEAVGMFMEKATAFSKSGEHAAKAMASGATPIDIATAAITPLRAKTRANAKRLRG